MIDMESNALAHFRPTALTHASVPPAKRKRLGISGGLVRLSVGVEDVRDLRDDLDRALA